MQILFATSEIFPLAKTGGLADVSAALPAELARMGADVRLAMPGYPQALERAVAKGPALPLGDLLGVGDVSLVPARTPDSGLPLWLVDSPLLFGGRPRPYVDPDGREWPDNAERFAVFCHAVVRLALGRAGVSWTPDLVHANDWQTGLVPALLAADPDPGPATLLTIHNLAFQGLFPPEAFPRLGLPAHWFAIEGVEFYGKVSFLKAGIRFADAVTTVSPTYAREIVTPGAGCGLDGLLKTRADDFVGILNGVDGACWAPDDPAQVPFPYSAQDLGGKRRCKAALQAELGLAVDPDAPLIAFTSRLTAQKAADLLPAVARSVLGTGAQFAVCGDGDRAIEAELRSLAGSFPSAVAVRIGYDEALARRMLAGADMLAAPSRFEPCGLVQMYAMRFGTLPVAHRVGGLADTVIGHEAAEAGPRRRQGATGFAFPAATVAAFAEAIRRAVRVYRQPARWRAMQVRAMARDFGWRTSASRYLALYRTLLGETGTAPAESAPAGADPVPRSIRAAPQPSPPVTPRHRPVRALPAPAGRPGVPEGLRQLSR